jgi:general secretion pathway protein L
MADWLLLRLPRSPEQPANWLVADPRGVPSGPPQSGPLSLAAPRTAGRRVCVLVPGTEVLLAEPDVPTRSGAKLQQLIPYALEEHLADDIDDLHFAIGKRNPDSTRAPVAVVARALLDGWLSALRANGIEPDVVYADSDLLPENPGQAVALLEEDAITVRAPGGSPVTLPADALAEALESARAGAETPVGRGLILYTGAPEWARYSEQVEAARPQFEGVKVQLLTGGPLALFAAQLPTATPINLLQGSYALTSGRAIGIKAWRIAAMLLGILFALHIVGKITELSVLKKHERQVDASIRDTFHSAMPGEVSPLDARPRMEARLAATRGAGGGLLPALQALAQARDSAPGTNLQSVDYKNGSVEMKLSAPDAASLDHLSQTLRNNGWRADLAGGTNVKSGYEGRIEVSSNGG